MTADLDDPAPATLGGAGSSPRRRTGAFVVPRGVARLLTLSGRAFLVAAGSVPSAALGPPLPGPGRATAGAVWFTGVLLVPLITLVAYPVSALIYQATHPSHMLPIPAVNGSSFPSFPSGPNEIDPWFMAAASAWVGLVYA